MTSPNAVNCFSAALNDFVSRYAYEYELSPKAVAEILSDKAAQLSNVNE